MNFADIAGRFAAAAAVLARFELEAARLLGDPGLPAVHRRDLRDRLEALAERARRHQAAIREAESSATPGDLAAEAMVERIDRLFLAELEAALEEGFRFMERRLGLLRTEQGAVDPAAGDRALRALAGEAAPSPAAADQLGLVALRASVLAEVAGQAEEAGARKLERELLEVKRKAFLQMATLAGAENPELLFKARLALERTLGEAPALRLGPEAVSEGSVALLPGGKGSLEAELLERGLRLRLEFRPSPGAVLPAGWVEGWVEAGGERAAFRLEDPRRLASGRTPDAAAREPATEASAAFLEFLGAHDLKALYLELTRRASELKEAELGAGPGGSVAERLSSALDSLLEGR